MPAVRTENQKKLKETISLEIQTLLFSAVDGTINRTINPSQSQAL